MAATTPKTGTPSRRRRPTGKAATRSDWEAALLKLDAIPAKANGTTAAEFLPKFVAALRDKGYVQDEIVERILGLRLGVTDRDIRAVDKQLRGAPTERPRAAVLTSPTPTAQPSGPRANGRPHAGLAGDEGLHRR